MSSPKQPDNKASPELVLLIHGTFANNPKLKDEAPYWWEENGDVWHTFSKQFPDKLRLAADRRTEVFCWSGDNSERDRRAGGRALFAHLLKLEKQGTAYHLIGHSHGGSVIWHCLQESVRQRLRRRRKVTDDQMALPSLRSWTTVGTPFLQLRAFGLITRLTPTLWFLLLISALASMYFVYGLKGQTPTALTDGAEATEALFNAGRNLLIRVRNHYAFEVATVLVSGLITFTCLVMWAWASAVKLESAVVREEARIRNQAFIDFGARWLGIWSRHDEAINSLRASLRLAGQIAPRISVSTATVFDFDRRMRTYRWLARWFIAPLFNLVVSRPTDGIIWRSVSRGMQGNDRPGCLVCDVTAGPIAPRNVQWEELPESYDTRLVERSNALLIERSRTLVPQLRDVLSQLAWSRPEQLSLLMSDKTTFEGNELIHTSYFNEGAIVELITCHLQRHSRAGVPQADRNSAAARWCQRFRHKARDLTQEASLHQAALPLLGERNRRAFLALLVAVAVCIGPFVLQANMLINIDRNSLTGLSFGASLLAFAGASHVVKRTMRGARGVRTARWAKRVSWWTLVAYTAIVAQFLIGELFF